MRAAVYDGGALRVGHWPDPRPGYGEVLIAPTCVGICGSDVHILDGSLETGAIPVILGHEPAGLVLDVGTGVPDRWVGRRVAILPIVTCGDCKFCRSERSMLCSVREVIGIDRHGAWADLLVVPERNVIEIPAGVSDDIAAVCTDSFAAALHAARKRGRIGPGTQVAIWGAGGLGLAAIAVARMLGAASIAAVDPRERARERAIAIGADLAIAPADAVAALRGQVDVALVASGGSESAGDAIRVLDRGGRAVVIGLGDGQISAGSLTAFATFEREVVGSFGSEPADVADALRMMASGRLALPGFFAEEVVLEDVLDGLRRVADGDADGGRVLVRIR